MCCSSFQAYSEGFGVEGPGVLMGLVLALLRYSQTLETYFVAFTISFLVGKLKHFYYNISGFLEL